MARIAVLILFIVGTVFIPLPVLAQMWPPHPYIVSFSSDTPAISLSDAEAGIATITLSWQVHHTEENIFWLKLEIYDDHWRERPDGDVSRLQWRVLAEGGLGAVGQFEVTLYPPQSFAPPMFLLSVIECYGCYAGGNGRTVVDSWAISIPYAPDPPDARPEIASFTADITNLDVAYLLSYDPHVSLSWQIDDRTLRSNLTVDQIFANGSTSRTCRAYPGPWIPSHDTHACALFRRADQPTEVRFRLRVYDVFTNEIYDEAEIVVPVVGEYPTPAPTITSQPPTTAP